MSGHPAWPVSPLIAHRCGGSLAPENTLAGLRAAAALGCRAVEFDVMLAADRVPVLIHDETLDRTTDGEGRVCERTAAELRRLDAGRRHSPRFAGERIPMLAEAAVVCRLLGLAANVEIKPAAGFEAETGEVVGRAVAELWRNAPDPPLLSSFSAEALAAARRAAPDLRRGLLFEVPPADCWEAAREFGAVTIHCAASAVDDAFLAAAREHRLPVFCYTVNDPEQAGDLLARGVAAVFTDRPDLLAAIVG